MSDLNKAVADPTLRDLLDLHSREVAFSINCHAVGTIQEFKSDTQTAIVQINYTKVQRQRADDGTYKSVQLNYPTLVDCPVVVLGGGNAFLTMPIKPGDECLVLFNDRDLDNWFAGAPTKEPQTPRLHSMSDALIIVGVRSLGKLIPDYDPNRPALRNKNTKVRLDENTLLIANATDSIGTILTSLNTTLNTLITVMSTATPATPYEIAVATAAATAVTQLTALQTKITGLLE